MLLQCVYILVKGNTTVVREGADAAARVGKVNKQVIYKYVLRLLAV